MRLSAVFSALFFVAVAASTAHAYSQLPVPNWPKGSATWYSKSPQYRDEMRVVARVLASSGARVRLTEARSLRKANIVLENPGGAAPCTGFASAGATGNRRMQSVITWGACVQPGHRFLELEAKRGTLRLLVHEVLHTYGVGHGMQSCAIMNTAQVQESGLFIPSLCRGTIRQQVGYSYCGYLEADDQAALLARYGGTKRKLGTGICRRSGPRAPATIKARVGEYTPQLGGHEIRVTWSGGKANVLAWARAGACPSSIEMAMSGPMYGRSGPTSKDGTGAVSVYAPYSGDYCVAVSGLLGKAMLGRMITTKVTIPSA